MFVSHLVPGTEHINSLGGGENAAAEGLCLLVRLCAGGVCAGTGLPLGCTGVEGSGSWQRCLRVPVLQAFPLCLAATDPPVLPRPPFHDGLSFPTCTQTSLSFGCFWQAFGHMIKPGRELELAMGSSL